MKKVINKLRKLKAKRVFIQFGEGLKLRIQDIAEKLKKEGFETVICCEPCFGSCDIREFEAKRLGCDAILHIGHEKIVHTKIPVIYWEYFMDSDPHIALEKDFLKLENFKKIGLITSIQFVKTIPKVKEYLEKKGKVVFVHKALKYPGQILGCNLEAAKKIEDKVECFLCISAGKFYGLGIVLATEKPVFNLDLESNEIVNLEDFRKKIRKIIVWNKSRLEESRNVGILVSWKVGQIKRNFFSLKKRLEKKGKTVYLIAMDEITPEKIEGLKLDFLINAACPRIGIDDLERYKIPMINIEDLD
ncbi:MAG: diphthamide biosynthesis enzyme Dph2 [Candidatus Aenigmatarchaeota archaeon]